MKRLCLAILALSLVTEYFSSDVVFASTDTIAQFTPVNIFEHYNCKLYTEEGAVLGSDQGSGVYFPTTCNPANTPQASRGTGISRSQIEGLKNSDGMIETSGKNRFFVDTSGAVMLGYNGFCEWELDINDYADSIALLVFTGYEVGHDRFHMQVYYEDGTVEEDRRLFISSNLTQTDDSLAVTAIRAFDGVNVTYQGRYANVVNMDLLTQETQLKKVSKIKISMTDQYIGTAVMAVTLKNNSFSKHDYTDNKTIDISEYCNGEFMSEYDDTIDIDKHGFIGESTMHINETYYKNYFNDNNEMYIRGVKYKNYQSDQRYKGIYTYNEKDKCADIPLKDEYYKKFCMLVTAAQYTGEEASTSHPKITDIPFVVTYSDGTKKKYTFDSGYDSVRSYYNSECGTVPDIIAGNIDNVVNWDISAVAWKNVSKPEEFHRGFVYSVEIPIDCSKPVVKISVGSEEKRVYIFAVTGIKIADEQLLDSVNMSIEELLAENEVYDALYSQVNFIREKTYELIALGTSNIKNYDKFLEIEEKLNNILSDKGYLEIFISQNGDDSNSGSEQNPVCSIDELEHRILRCDSALDTMDIHAVFLEGDYRFNTSLSINKNKSRKKIIYRNKPGDNVTFYGSTEIPKENFQVTSDKAVLERLTKQARGKVYECYAGDLNIPLYTQYQSPYLFADRKRQTIAKYPNDGFTSIKGSVKNYIDGYSSDYYTQVSLYEEGNDWSLAENAYAEGYFDYDYSYKKLEIMDFNNSERIITVKGANEINPEIYPDKPRRFRIVNLLEEIDEEEEWYYDKSCGKIYWYPKNFDSIETVSVTTLKDPVIYVNGADNIEIRGINFAQCGGIGIKAENTNGFVIEGCSFSDINGDSINLKQNYNTKVKNCIITAGSKGISADSGNFKTLESTGNVIENNVIYDIGWGHGYGSNAALRINDIGCKIVNNTIYNTPSTAILYSGNDNYIAFNEIYDVCREANDSSAIYAGRQYLHRGTEICYNYIHDIVTQYNWSANRDFGGRELNWVYAFYFDDGLCGQYAHNNILENIPTAFNINCGQFNVAENNTIVNMRDDAFWVTSYNLGDEARSAREKESWDSIAEYADLYISKYPELSYGYEYFSAQPANNIVRNNLVVAAKDEPMITKENTANNGIFENNIMPADFDGFLNSENGDYRVVSDSYILKQLPDITTVGMLEMSDIGSKMDREDNIYVRLSDDVGSVTDVFENIASIKINGSGIEGSDVYCAFFDDNERLERVLKMTVTGNNAEASVKSADGGKISDIKLFIWKQDTIMPLCKAKNLN